MNTAITKKRNCIKEKLFDPLKGSTNRIYLPLERDEHEELIRDLKKYRNFLNEQIQKYPELLPEKINDGYKFHGIRESKKLEMKFRRIQLKNKKVFMLVPCFVMPYMTATTEEVEKALFLRKFGVPYWGLSYTFGKNDMFWYRLEKHIGRNSIVGTTIKHASKLPKDLLADEKHSKENKQKFYIPVTIANGCILGASTAAEANASSLTDSYSYFKTEALNVDAEYSPVTVNTDGWNATRKAWLELYPCINLILCFLHSFLKIRDARHLFADFYKQVCQFLWDAYHSENGADFYEQLLALQIWARDNISDARALDIINKICRKGCI